MGVKVDHDWIAVATFILEPIGCDKDYPKREPKGCMQPPEEGFEVYSHQIKTGDLNGRRFCQVMWSRPVYYELFELFAKLSNESTIERFRRHCEGRGG